MQRKILRPSTLAILGLAAVSSLGLAAGPAPVAPKAVVSTVAGMPAVLDADNLYSETRTDQLLPAVKDDLARLRAQSARQ